MAEFSSEMECVSMAGQVQGGDDHHGKDQQQIHQGGSVGGGENTLLALQETPGDPAVVDGDDVVCDEVVERVKEKPRLTMTKDMKPRLRWTRELHSHFVDVCNQLGGPKKATPKTVLELMDIDGLSLYHVKSHLQKYRMGRCTDNQYWTEAEITETTVDPVSGSSSNGSPSNPIPPRTNQNNRSRRGKRNQKHSTHGELYLKLEAEKCVQRCLEAQRMYLRTAVQHAYQTYTNQYLGDGAMGNSIMYGQASAGLGNFATMPEGISGYGTSVTTMPPFYFNQQNAYPEYNNTLTTPTDLNFQQLPLGYQPQASSFHLAPQGDLSTSYANPGTGSTTYQEASPSPVLADNEVLPPNEISVEVVLPPDEISVEVFFNWDDNEPQNLDNVLNL